VIVGLSLAACGTSGSAKPIAAATQTTESPMATLAVASPVATPEIAEFNCVSYAVPWDGKAAISLTGTWAGDDKGVYYIREIGNQIWWLGMSGVGQPLITRGFSWTNVYNGELSGHTITGRYADVPQGDTLLSGPVVMEVARTRDGGVSLVRTTPDSETDFGGRVLTPCALK
jgi:hypothetical protein